LINPCLANAPQTDERGFGLDHFSANSHVFRADRGLKFEEITDGTANTLLFGEINANFQPWGKPMNVRDPAKGINRSPHGFGGAPFAGGAYFAMADGSVRFIGENVSRDVLRALATPNGGETIDPSVLQDR
jgi:prepilin-type processing-associated H-X9-DG protein